MFGGERTCNYSGARADAWLKSLCSAFLSLYSHCCADPFSFSCALYLCLQFKEKLWLKQVVPPMSSADLFLEIYSKYLPR
mmetsp:Transcript_13952/g.27123  ORF Transcript_13952/g.27123 Transcript_13952/m.27123 type:complete len:80 (+) Transcript_13952:1471-1710(+)